MHARACFVLIGLSAPVSLFAQQKVQLPARDKILPDQPALVYTLGKEEGNDWEILSGVIAVAFDARDNLYVLDSKNFRVLVFDASGKFVRRIGQKGQGPGEFMVPTGMTVMTDGTVVVSDGGRHAYSLFRSDGTFLKNLLYGDGEGVGGRTAMAATADFWLDGLHPHPRGGIVAQISIRPVPRPGQLGAPTGERKVAVRRIDLTAGGIPTALYEFTLPSITPTVTDLGSGRVSVSRQIPHWSPAHTIGVLPNGGIVAAHEADYRVKIVNPAGQVERIIERPITPRKGTPADKEAFIKREREYFAQGGMQLRGEGGGSAGPVPPEMIEQRLKNATWLEVVPVLRRVGADPQGRIWVARTPADFGVYGPIDILRADGTYVGTIANALLPGAVSKTGRAAFIERDELDVEHVTVKRLPATWQ